MKRVSQRNIPFDNIGNNIGFIEEITRDITFLG